jgi:hypothetical protein
MLPQLIDYASSLVMGLLLLWGAWKNHLKLPLTIVAVLTLVEPVIIPVVFSRARILPRSPIFLEFSALSLVITITLIWGAWTNHLKRSLLLVRLLVIVRQLIILRASIISSVVYNPGGAMPQIVPLAIGITLIWVAWTDRWKSALMIWGAVLSIMCLVVLVPTLILLIMYLPYLLGRP